MAAQSEFNLRAALCRKLARREPANRAYWMAEADYWLRLSEEALRCAEDRTAVISNQKKSCFRASADRCHPLT
jgi:hypothetical protein